MVTKREEGTIGPKAVRRDSVADIWGITSSSVVGRGVVEMKKKKSTRARLQGTRCVWFNAVAQLFWGQTPCGPHTSAVPKARVHSLAVDGKISGD